MGEFQRAGDQLWVTARIVDVETGMIRENVSIEGWLGPSSAMRVGFPHCRGLVQLPVAA